MSVTQLAVFLENEPGRLAEVTRALGDAGVNIRGFSVADTTDFGILRLILDAPERAYDALKARSFTVRRSQVLCVRVQDRPGALAALLDSLGERGLNVEYMYPIALALIVFGIEDMDGALEVFREKQAVLVDDEAIRRL